MQARLAPEIFLQFSEVAKAKRVTKGQLARDAILFYLAHERRSINEKPDRVIAEEIDRLSANQVNATRQMADRVCGMLSKIHTDLGVILELHCELESDERIADLMSKSAKRVGKKLSTVEKEIRDKMSKVMRNDSA